MPLAITPTFRPWTHTSDDCYIYQLSLVVATATVSYDNTICPPNIPTRRTTTVQVYKYHRYHIVCVPIPVCMWVPFGYIDHTRFAICAVSTCFGHFFVVSCHCHVRQEPAAAGHRDEHSGRRSSSNNGGQCGQCVLPTVRRSLIVHLFRRLHSESLKHTSNGDTHRYTAAYDM